MGNGGHGGGLWRHGDTVETVREAVQAGVCAVETGGSGQFGEVAPMAEP